MDLSGVRVLIDGYNLELRQGTGISTYSMTLVEALRQLKADVSVLCSSWGSRDPVLTEVLLFDRLREEPRRPHPAHLIGAFKAITGMPLRPQHVSVGQVVTKVELGTFYGQVASSVDLYTLGDCYQIANILHKVLGMTTSLTNPGKIDVWHATSPLPLKIKGAKRITTLHDIIPLRLPHMTFDVKKSFYYNVRNSVRESDLIICVSESAKRDILEFFDVNPDKLFVLHQPIALPQKHREEREIEACLAKYNLQRKRYLLYVGSLEPRKNIGGLARAYEGIDTEMPLVMVGKRFKRWEQEVRKVESIRNVKILDFVSADELRSLYAGAYCFAFPSFYEGFGLPPLEAMTFGCPVITSNVSSLPEVCGDAALYVDPTDVNDIREKLWQVLSSSALRDRLSSVGRERARLFSMEQYVQKLLGAYQLALGR